MSCYRIGTSDENEPVYGCDDQTLETNQTYQQPSMARCGDSEGKNKDEDIIASEIDINSPAWLHSSNWNPSHETVVLIHGYGGTADYLPVGILKDGTYLRIAVWH